MDTVRLDKLVITEISGVDHGANNLDGWVVTKARGGALRGIEVAHVAGSAAMHQAERLRKACGDDELFLDILQGRAIVFEGQKGGAIFKAKHSTRSPNGSGRFHPVAGGTTTADGITWRHAKDGKTLPALARLARNI